ncbi:component of the polarisome [Dinochytrium kinnereticum]|nr:component of the polarisome [Dinochytrium kinnereticum]
MPKTPLYNIAVSAKMNRGGDPSDGHVAVQYESLRQYLDSYVNSPRQLASAKSTQRISARERLSGLSKQQLLDLVTDVYDEIDRRVHHSNELPFLPIRPDLHQKRNQARQKLATMGTAPFKDFASDIMAQIERRFPQFVEAYDVKFGINQGPPPNNNNFAENEHQSPLNSQGDMSKVRGREPQANEYQNGPPNGFSSVAPDRMRDEYESKLDELRLRVKDLEKELQDKADLESSYRKLEQDHIRLKEDYDLLQEDFNNQQLTAQDIKAEASNLLEEIRELSGRNQQLTEELNALRKGRNDEMGGAKGGAKQQDYPNEGSPRSYNEPKESPSNGNNNFGNGVIDRDRVSAYQSAVDDLLRAAREAPSSVLVAMKAIVIACKNITEDTEAYEVNSNSLSEDDKDNLEAVKGRLSGALTGLMHAAKNHATNFGSSPVSALEGAASNLTATIVELVKIFKLRGENQNDYSQNERRYTDASMDSRKQAPPPLDMYDLKIYLEKQTDQIVQSIQTLLHSMRQSANGEEFRDIISGITRTVNEVINESDGSTLEMASGDLRDRIKPVLDDLAAANQKLNDLGYSILEQPQSKTLKQRIASSSYDIAKFVKELISIIGELKRLSLNC